MMSKGSKLSAGRVSVSSVQLKFRQLRCWDLMAMISGHLTLASQGWEEMKHHLEVLLDAAADSQAKPSKKPQRTAKPRTSAHPKA